MKQELICISCKRKITNMTGTTKFKCPSCNQYEIVRCRHCREVASKFTCPECGLTGPN